MKVNVEHKIAAVQVADRLAAAGKIEQNEIQACTNEIYAWLIGRVKEIPQRVKGETLDMA